MSKPVRDQAPTRNMLTVADDYDEFWAAPTAAQRLEEARELQRNANARAWRRIFYVLVFALVAFSIWKAIAA